MELWQAALLGIVEGLTEFLPVSSTGHLILTTQLLGIASPEGAFEIVIQSGAVAAVIWHYRAYLWDLSRRCLASERAAWGQVRRLLIAFIPAVVFGLTFGKWIKHTLFGMTPVIGALIVGGVVLIVVERRRRTSVGRDEVQTSKEALGIGLFQCLALWPGTSRSMATILGGRLLGLSAKSAAEFSFLLAIPTLLGAGAHDLYKHGHELAGLGLPAIGVGIATSFVTALLVIRFFLGFLGKNSLEIFGWYRVVLGGALLAYLFLALPHAG
jgi:undecaprenyl-diphosphatase